MGHIVKFLHVKDKKSIMAEASEWFAENCDRNENRYGKYPASQMHIREYQIFACEEDAERYIRNETRNLFYYDMAVQYRDVMQTAKTKAEIELQNRIKEKNIDLNEYIKKNSVHMRSEAFMTCKHCGSRVSLAHFRSEYCPVCGDDLRRQTVTDMIKKKMDAIDQLKQRLTDERSKKKDKAPLMWLVKVEAHC